MTTQHTPGPWRILVVYDSAECQQKVTVCTPYTYAKDGTGISEQHVSDCGAYTDGEVYANARLIAAAPDLLAALKGLRALIIGECGASTYECVDGEQADAAIAKAEGR